MLDNLTLFKIAMSGQADILNEPRNFIAKHRGCDLEELFISLGKCSLITRQFLLLPIPNEYSLMLSEFTTKGNVRLEVFTPRYSSDYPSPSLYSINFHGEEKVYFEAWDIENGSYVEVKGKLFIEEDYEIVLQDTEVVMVNHEK